jgi:hypothetical protein
MRATLDLPHSILVLLARRWLSVIYVFAVLIILSAMLLASQGVLSVGWKLLGIVGSSPSAGTSVQARTGQEVA